MATFVEKLSLATVPLMQLMNRILSPSTTTHSKKQRSNHWWNAQIAKNENNKFCLYNFPNKWRILDRFFAREPSFIPKPKIKKRKEKGEGKLLTYVYQGTTKLYTHRQEVVK